jgi:hypothetical protein
MTPRLTALSLFLLPLAACATVEPQPCTAEWIDYKTDKTFRKFASENRGLINDFRKLSREDGDVDPLVAMSLARKSGRIQKFADSFNTVVLPELEAALDQCGQQEEFVPALTAFLQDEGVSDDAITWIIPFIGVMTEMRNGTFELDGHHEG